MMRYALNAIWVFLVFTGVGCSNRDVAGMYEATVPFRGKDPRFVGDQYIWQLHLKEDGSFSCTFELPVAVYTEDGHELVGKGKGTAKGKWTQQGGRVVLTRESGKGSLGSTNTVSFSFRDGCLRILISGGRAHLREGDSELVLKKIPDKEPESNR